MFNFIETTKIKVKHAIESKKLQKKRDEELKVLRQQKEFETSKTSLEREVELEELKAEVRKHQQKSLPKPGQKIPEKKTGFAKFQDYCTDFAKNQPNIVGNLDMNLGGTNGKRRYKKGSKRSRAGIGGSLY